MVEVAEAYGSGQYTGMSRGAYQYGGPEFGNTQVSRYYVLGTIVVVCPPPPTPPSLRLATSPSPPLDLHDRGADVAVAAAKVEAKLVRASPRGHGAAQEDHVLPLPLVRAALRAAAERLVVVPGGKNERNRRRGTLPVLALQFHTTCTTQHTAQTAQTAQTAHRTPHTFPVLS